MNLNKIEAEKFDSIIFLLALECLKNRILILIGREEYENYNWKEFACQKLL